MDDCLICKIVVREKPANLIYQDSKSVAFLSQFPLTKGHTIVAPKRHFADIFDADLESLTKVTLVVKAVSDRMRLVLGTNGVNLINNSGKLAGQDVFHFHVHIVPRSRGDELDLKEWWLSKAVESKESELKQLESKLRFDATTREAR